MKKMICIVLSIAMMISCVIMPVGAFAKPKAQIYKDGKHAVAYEVQNDNTIKILAYRYLTDCDSGEIKAKLPKKINEKWVTAIDSKFSDAKNITKLFGELPENASYRIVDIKLPSKLKKIENNAFAQRRALKKITIPDSVEYIGECAFAQCENLKEIHIGKNVKYIGESAFFITDSNSYTRDGGAIYLGNYLLWFEASDIYEKERSKAYTIKDGTTLIADEAFSLAYAIGKIYFPKSVKYIPDNIFGENSDLKVICCAYRGTAAEKFAKEKGATFKALNPAAPKITVKAGKKKLKVSWKSVKSAEGYQIKYNSKTTETKNLKKTIKLKKGTYKVKVRAYKIKDGKRVYSPWSKAQTVKVK